MDGIWGLKIRFGLLKHAGGSVEHSFAAICGVSQNSLLVGSPGIGVDEKFLGMTGPFYKGSTKDNFEEAPREPAPL